MSKLFKQLLSTLTAFLLVFSTFAVVRAEGVVYTIHIRNAKAGQTYKAYKILDMQVLDAETGSVIQSALKEKDFQTEAEAQEYKTANGGYYHQISIYNPDTGNYDIDAYRWYKTAYMAEYLISTDSPYYSAVEAYDGLTLRDSDDTNVKAVTVEDSFKPKDFVNQIRPIMEQQTPAVTVTADANGQITLNLQEEGYYALNTTTGTMVTTFHSQSEYSTEVWINDKNPYLEVTESVSDHDVEIGDIVKFTINADLPNNISDFDEDYVYELTSVIPDGLRFNGDVRIRGKYDGEPIEWTDYSINKTGTGTYHSYYAYTDTADEISEPRSPAVTQKGVHYKPGLENSVTMENYADDGSSEIVLLNSLRLIPQNNASETVTYTDADDSFTLKVNKVNGIPTHEMGEGSGPWNFKFSNPDLADVHVGDSSDFGFKISFTCLVLSDAGIRNVEEFGDKNLGLVNTTTLTYSCNPDTTETKTMTCSERVRTGDIVISSVLDKDASIVIPGGEYVLQNMDDKYYKFCNKGEYHPFEGWNDPKLASFTVDGPHIEWVDNIEEADIIIPDENGTAVIRGLEPLSEFNVSNIISTYATGGLSPVSSDSWESESTSTSGPGMYRLIMTKKPTGYNKLKEPVDVTLPVEEDTPTLDYPVVILNNQGYLLPTTGEIGGLIMALIGCGAVIALVVYLTGSKKR